MPLDRIPELLAVAELHGADQLWATVVNQIEQRAETVIEHLLSMGRQQQQHLPWRPSQHSAATKRITQLFQTLAEAV
jgi:hypothetical protein